MTERKKTGPKGPTKPMDDKMFEQVVQMVRIQCTLEEIASVIGMSDDSLNARIAERGIEGITNFAGLYKKHSGEGKASLRRAQYQTAINGNPTMQIWLGKQWLAQSDRLDVNGSFNVNMPDDTKKL